jgi:Ca-activated chloride channel family protein
MNIRHQYRIYLCIILFSGFLFGFTWGDTLARQMRKGNEAFEAGNYDEALKAYTEADVNSKADDPRLPQLYNNMGTTLYQQGQYEQAVAMYQKALEASQDQGFKADTLFNSGNSRFKQGDYQKALDAYKQALEQDPEHLQAQHNKQIVEQLIEQQQQQQQQQQENQNQQQNQENDQQQEGQPSEEQQQEQGQPTPQPTAQPEEQEPQEQQPEQAQPAEEDDEEEEEQDLSEEEALRILDALMEKEQLQQEQRQVPPRPVDKDW